MNFTNEVIRRRLKPKCDAVLNVKSSHIQFNIVLFLLVFFFRL